MKKKRLTNRTLSRWILLLLMLVTGTTQGVAQNVTIGPNNGSIITGQAGGNMGDSGIRRGMGSMWRHQQLPLTMTSSDMANLTAAGELADPACAIDKITIDGETRLLLGAGQTNEYIVVSLPKGFRITGYRLVLQPNVSGNNIQLHEGKESWNIGTNDKMRFYETPAWSSANPYGSGTNLVHDGDLGIPDAIATATAADGQIDMYNSDEEERSKEFVIERTGNDITNQLYFYFATAEANYAVTIKSFEIRFTAQGTFEADVTPVSSGEATSVVEVPFSTSKMDIGDVEIKQNLYTYDYTGVRDVIAYNWLYQDDAVNTAGMPDKTKTVETKNIHPVVVGGEAAYAFGNDTYFVEPPTTVKTSGNSEEGKEAPIAYRVVGAKFDCKWADDVVGGTLYNQNSECQIISSRNDRPYLNDQLIFTNEDVRWNIDEYGNIYRETNGTRRYLACRGSQNNRIVCLSSSPTGKESTWNLRLKEINGNPRICYTEDGNNYILYTIDIQEGSENHTRPYVELNHSNNLARYNITSTQNITVQPFYQGAKYTLDVYGTDKTTVVESRTLTSAADACSFTVSGLNNDAVMFKISELADKTVNNQTVKTQALVNVTLLLEALNPYIDKMDIVCHDAPNPNTGKPNLELTQSFTANDFSVSGGKFIFYVPSDYSEVPLTFTFSNLYSKYGDDTYYRGTPDQKDGTARYSFVTSDYFKKVSGNQVEGVTGFSKNDGLYDQTYYQQNGIGSNGPEAGEGKFYPYTAKVFTSTAGNVRFKFNNAEELAAGTSTGTEHLVEYPFSVTTYLDHYKDPDWKSSSNTTQEEGAFVSCILIADPSASPTGTDYVDSDIFYVFTADETRYNIAPTKALQHRAYAFYTMDIELEARTFKPEFTWKPVYDKTFYTHETKDEQGNVTESIDVEDSMWGLELKTQDEVDPVTGKKIVGYLTYQEIIDNILGRDAIYYTQAEANAYNTKHNLQPGHADYKTTESIRKEAVARRLSDNNQGAPKYMRQILYVDGTPLSAMLNSSENSVVKTLQDLKDSLAVNNLVFLPENTTSTLDNVAYKTSSGGFLAGKDIKLTDKQPFYSPYTIQVDAANMATYTRVLTQPDYGQAVNATVMLPFTLKLEDGLHTNEDGKCSFTVNTMATGAQMATVGSSSVNYGTAYFEPLTASTTEANKPYMIKVETIDESVSNGNKISFIATQKGSSIVKTPNLVSEDVFSGKLIQGETAQGKYSDVDYYFTNYASYSGGKFDRAVSENVFYFSKNKYVDLHTLYPGTLQYLMSYPFRGVYTYSTSAPADPTSGAKPMKGFYISYDLDEMEDAGFVTRLEQLGTKADMMIRSGKGFITITATADQKFMIRTLNGMAVKNVGVNAGNTTTVNLPAGIYLVNNTKITVK